MPCLRGIDVKLVTYPAKQIIQEYPHPDGSSLRLVTRPEAASTVAKDLSTAGGSPSSSKPVVPSRKADPRSSVYIATQPGSQFIIAYDINEIPDSCKFVNFKVFVNGRHMVTCGRDLEDRTRGVICRTLWAPSDRWDLYAGIEGRQFVFLPDEKTKSAAEDGGLIEVQVHRAVARSLRSPALQEFRPARQYGIATPSTGFIETPEEVEWYKYHLIDPKDTPYARFFFHYRSFDSLKELNLIPEESFRQPKHASGKGKEPCRSSKQQPSYEVEHASRSSTPDPAFLWTDGAADDDRPVATSLDRSMREHKAQSAKLPAQHSQARRRENVPAAVQAGRSDRSALSLQRPLPELPFGGLAPPPRETAKSPAPSLSPSLKQSVDDGDFDDDIEIAEPEVVRYNKVIHKPTLLNVAPGRNSTSSFDLPRSGPTVHRHVPGNTRHSYQPTTSASSVHHPRSFASRRLHIPGTIAPRQHAGGGEILSQRHEPSQSRAQFERHSYQPTSGQPTGSRPRDNVSHQQGRPGAQEMVQGVIGHEQRRPAQSLGLTVPTYRGADTMLQAQVRRSPQRQRPQDLDLSSTAYSTPQQPSTYNALRDIGAAMLSGSTFRRNDSRTHVQSFPAGRSPARNNRPSDTQSSAERGQGRSSMQSGSSRYSSSATTPIRSSFADQRWTPRNAPPEPRGGVSWEDFVRQSPRHESTIDRMISELNGFDDPKENRPPSDNDEE
ncbi:hypothetical protein BR93DRAFT_936320 [Coniochaeta sp. PMI_546]|nr:hypothetical protein BR93DRAFT_936320 [Coniochaeta sp. PMI_546]